MNTKKEIIRNDAIMCINCKKFMDITEVAKMYREEGQNPQKEKDLEMIEGLDFNDFAEWWEIKKTLIQKIKGEK